MKNTNGKSCISAYHLACGWVESKKSLSLEKHLSKEGGVYHVKSTLNNSPELHSDFSSGKSHKYTIWESFETVKEARAFFNKIK